MSYDDVITYLKTHANPDNVKGMARYGINPENCLGISIYNLRDYAKTIGKNHDLALELWSSGIHEARLLAVFIDDPDKITSEQMNTWAQDFNSWDICDQACTSLFDQTSFAWEKIFEWAKRDEEFVRRAAFSLIAGLAVHDKTANDKTFEDVFPLITTYAVDERYYVKKAVNWALRNIGKRNVNLNKKTIRLSEEIVKIPSKSARWIAHDAIRELQSEKVQTRLSKKKR
jgi:3-methyladenine DNA glycosylase AlkD